MKTLLLTCGAITALTSPALAQRNKSEVRDGKRYLVPKDESTQNAEGNLVQQRAIDLGFFQWPIPTEKVAADVNRPRSVADCKGHDPGYKRAPDYAREPDARTMKAGLAHTFIYEWMAYRNAIVAMDCTCNSLTADWSAVNSAFDALTEGVSNPNIFTEAVNRARNGIKDDFDRMCDISIRLELE